MSNFPGPGDWMWSVDCWLQVSHTSMLHVQHTGTSPQAASAYAAAADCAAALGGQGSDLVKGSTGGGGGFKLASVSRVQQLSMPSFSGWGTVRLACSVSVPACT